MLRCNGGMDTPLELAMTQQAKVRGDLRLRVDGREVSVPEGPVDVEFGDAKAKLHWKDAQGRDCRAEIEPDDYERYVVAGWILPSLN
jgi:hypothetical protein